MKSKTGCRLLLYTGCALLLLSCLARKAGSPSAKTVGAADEVGRSVLTTVSRSTHSLPLQQLRLPDGFTIDVWAAELEGARSLTRSPHGVIYVGTRGEGRVYALRDTDGDHKADKRYTIASGLTMPNGVAWREGALYVAEVYQVLRFDDIDRHLDRPPEAKTVLSGLPRDRHHGWKFIAFGPDGKLYVPVGAPCNVCAEEDERYAAILRVNPDGSDLEVYAAGVRNTVGFDWHPATGHLWFTDNGRDWLGDDLPPDELNHAPEQGLHFGFPYCHGGFFSDPDLCEEGDCCGEAYRKPAWKLDAHVAALGMRFYTASMFPPAYQGRILIAEHGSWNRSTPSGYRIGMATLAGEQVVEYQVFVDGWLDDGEAWGRPVDVLQMPDGAVLVSDDHADAIYRISYEG